MAIRIKFDKDNNPLPPTLVLANRNGNKLGVLPAVNLNLHADMKEADELQFRVYKYDNGAINPLWYRLLDFKLVWCPEWDIWFEIAVDVSDGSSGIYKNVSAKSLGEAELSQIMLYDIQINTEDDIARDDYVETVLYNQNNPEGSLLNRILEKAPHYKVGHVDESIANIQRTFEFDGKSILDALGEIGEEIDCIFILGNGSDSNGKPARTINAYDLEAKCQSCGNRGEFADVCPKCGSTNIAYGYGQFTNIYVSSENLADEVSYTSGAESVKNCFRLEPGDDLMIATVANSLPDGSGYIWHFTDDMREDMSDALKQRLSEYETDYEYYESRHVTTLSASLVNSYNGIVSKYRAYRPELPTISGSITGYAGIMEATYNAIDLSLYLASELMPAPEMSEKTAETEAAKLTASAIPLIAVTNAQTCSTATANSAALSIAKDIVDKGFQVKVDEGDYDGTNWTGNFVVTNYSDEDDVAYSDTITVRVTDDFQSYLNQRINNIISDASEDVTDIESLFKLSGTAFANELKKHCLNNLVSFYDACQSCVDLLIQQGVADNKTWASQNPNLYMTMYQPYYTKLGQIQAEIKTRENEILVITGQYNDNGGITKDGIQTQLNTKRNQIQKALDFEAYFGKERMLELSAYRRDDTFSDSNYISDGLDSAELFDRAQEFVKKARTEIHKSSELQHHITASLRNLLAMQEFAPIVDSFETGNWLNLRIDIALYRLRLQSYEIDFDAQEAIDVEFADTVNTISKRRTPESIFKSAATVSTTYNTVRRQADRGAAAQRQLASIFENGIVLKGGGSL